MPIDPATFTGVEIRSTSNGNPPDMDPGRQATCSAALWMRRITAGEAGPWERVYFRSKENGLKAAEKALRGYLYDPAP